MSNKKGIVHSADDFTLFGDNHYDNGDGSFSLDAGQRFNYKNIAANATTVVDLTPGFLHSIIVGTAGSAWTITVWDNTSAAGNKIATISGNAQVVLVFDVQYLIGLTIVTAGTTAGDLTVSYR